MIVILTAGALATVQDLGRAGCLRWGVGTSGAMDTMALAAGNLLLGNPEGAAAIEVPVFPFRVRFDADCSFALTGADSAARLDGVPLLPWSRHVAKAGQELHLGLPQPGPGRGSRAYLCVGGGVDVPEVLHSRSTQLRGAFGGLEGRALRKGDILRAAQPARAASAAGLGLVPPAIGLPLEVDGCAAMRVLPAAEYERYTPASRAAFWAGEWKITPQSDRYGYRLAGQALQVVAPTEMRSHGIVPGVIQVPPDGQPIVQMRDAQPSGGYPKFGTVIEADLWRLGQAPIGSRIRFIETGWDEALAALEQLRQWLDQVARMVALHGVAA
ncbi:MAG: allophanate hydrolase [Ramlibacter sp.]|nr:allophanate hydrolase [Ramlibacter sp.]